MSDMTLDTQQARLDRASQGRNPNEVSNGVREPYVDGPTVAAIQTAFARSRLSHAGWQPRQIDGRLDSRAAWRNDARGHVDIFRDRRAPSNTKLDVWLLVDSSGSMNGIKINRAQDVVGTLAEAFSRLPTVNLHVWQHGAHVDVRLFRAYEKGKPSRINQMILQVHRLGGGNADGFALQAIGNKALAAKRADTKTLVIMISDGLPSVHGRGAKNFRIEDHSANVARFLRAKGVGVMAVAIDGLNTAHAVMYGAENVVPFNQTSPTRWFDLSRDFAAIFGRTLREAR